MLAKKREGGWLGFPPMTKRGWPIFELSSRLFGKEDFHGEKHNRWAGRRVKVEKRGKAEMVEEVKKAEKVERVGELAVSMR